MFLLSFQPTTSLLTQSTHSWDLASAYYGSIKVGGRWQQTRICSFSMVTVFSSYNRYAIIHDYSSKVMYKCSWMQVEQYNCVLQPSWRQVERRQEKKRGFQKGWPRPLLLGTCACQVEPFDTGRNLPFPSVGRVFWYQETLPMHSWILRTPPEGVRFALTGAIRCTEGVERWVPRVGRFPLTEIKTQGSHLGTSSDSNKYCITLMQRRMWSSSTALCLFCQTTSPLSLHCAFVCCHPWLLPVRIEDHLHSRPTHAWGCIHSNSSWIMLFEWVSPSKDSDELHFTRFLSLSFMQLEMGSLHIPKCHISHKGHDSCRFRWNNPHFGSTPT
jgi:hypothetical protein